MKEYLLGFYYSFPVQLVLLHIRRYQLLLLFWIILFGVINGDFMHTFGADSMFLAPEYMGKVNVVSASFIGMALGIFLMSWNITTFILHSKQFTFLATTSKPFLKYCINNAVIPLLFLLFYCWKAVEFDRFRELMNISEILLLIAGFLLGLIFIVAVTLTYFFGAEKTMLRHFSPVLSDPQRYLPEFGIRGHHHHEKGIIDVDWFFNTNFKLKRPREVSHYPKEFLDEIFKRHHISAVLSIILAFLFLSLIGLLIDSPYFEMPAAAAILLLMSVLIGGAGALVYWLKSWSLPVFLLFLAGLNYLLVKDIIDPRNKAYGLDYTKKENRPKYERESIYALCTEEQMEKDRQQVIGILENWKARQKDSLPKLYIISVSGGGARSATFVLTVLQRLDSIMGGDLMKKTAFISGASGGMIGTSYYRELYRRSQLGQNIKMQDPVHLESISKDLLNPLFTSMATRDLLSPAQRFQVGDKTYVKDRGYAFEQKLLRNTGNILDQSLEDYYQPELQAKVPMLVYNSTITADGRKMIISPQPVSYLMRDRPDSANGIMSEPDGIDFSAFFANKDPQKLRILSVLRMNATFPYVLPNVWLPSQPVIDVMDGGLRDNYGQETSIRFLRAVQDWIEKNTSGVVSIQIRDRVRGEWEHFYDDATVGGLLFKPMMSLQYNWMKIQDYYQEVMVNEANQLFDFPFEKVEFMYIPSSKNRGAALNFHLTTQEKLDIKSAVYNQTNRASMERISKLNGRRDH